MPADPQADRQIGCVDQPKQAAQHRQVRHLPMRPKTLNAVARITGGGYFYAATARDLNAVFLAWRGARPV